MKRTYSFLAMVLFLMGALCHLFVSCASTQAEPEPLTPVVYVTNTKKINILPTALISRNMDEVQLFEGSFGDKTFIMPLYIQADDSGISISMLSDMGTSLGELSYAGNTAEFSSDLFPQELKAEYVIWDVQLSCYDADSLSKTLAKEKLSFSVENADGIETRKIMDGNSLVEEIVIAENSTLIRNYLRGYEFCLTGVGNE